MTARILNVTEDEYHADPCAVPSLSQSIAHTLIAKSPAHAYIEHPRLGKPTDVVEKSTKAVDEGSIIHALLLGKGPSLDVLKFDNYKTKAAQEIRDAAWEAGRIPVLERRYVELLSAAAALRTNLAGCGIELSGQSEVAIEWNEDGAEGPVLCRARLDHLLLGSEAVIYDVKKITSADARTRSRSAIDYGHDIQEAAYRSGVSKVFPKYAGRVDFMDLYMELDPPYAVVPARPSAALRWHGESRWRRAVFLWERCLLENRWPSYTDKVTTTEAPIYAINAEEELANAG